MNQSDYCTRVGLDVSEAAVNEARTQLWRALDEAKSASVPSTPHSLAKLYEFKVPKLSADGSCSLHDELDDKPYDLSVVLGGRTLTATTRLMTLDTVIAQSHRALQADWLGVYQARTVGSGPALVKLAYRGAPSRAEFPLTAEFAKKSNNARVALSGRATVIHDVAAHVASGGEYYECDPRVQAEACVPVLDEAGHVVGLVDAEHSVKGWFTRERLGAVVALALELPKLLPSGGFVVT